jgi:hypothetical protein
MARMLWIASLSVALASTADAVKASAAHPLESLAATASSLESARRSCLLRLSGIAKHRDRAASCWH